ncbi:MAG: hypothetical protein M3144_06990 [Actinomycetota bacterium]|nr:hypothetical protein [Actinomycetota bacterium]
MADAEPEAILAAAGSSWSSIGPPATSPKPWPAAARRTVEAAGLTHINEPSIVDAVRRL